MVCATVRQDADQSRFLKFYDEIPFASWRRPVAFVVKSRASISRLICNDFEDQIGRHTANLSITTHDVLLFARSTLLMLTTRIEAARIVCISTGLATTVSLAACIPRSVCSQEWSVSTAYRQVSIFNVDDKVETAPAMAVPVPISLIMNWPIVRRQGGLECLDRLRVDQ